MRQHFGLILRSPLSGEGEGVSNTPYASISFRRITQADFCVNCSCIFAWVAGVRGGLWHGMDRFTTTPSPNLQEANRRLHQLRRQAQGQRQIDGLFYSRSESVSPATAMESAAAASLPTHLGWGSEPLSAVIRQQQPACVDESEWLHRLAETSTSAILSTGTPVQIGASASTPSQSTIDTPVVKLYPHIGLGMLRQEKTAPGRLWLMLHHLDVAGCGQLRIDNMRATLTPKAAPMRLCGKRQLRNLLRDGDGLFWTRDKERVWLHSAARVAYALDVERLTGRPVSVPVSALLAGIGSFRAHLYAAFHSGRVKKSRQGTRAGAGASRQSMPIARETLAQLSGVGQSSQRTYEAKTKVNVQTNYAIGEVAQGESWESRAWANGQAVFALKDYRGEQGKKGQTYLAWQLPNSYSGTQSQRPLGRQKRINRTLKDLVTKGMPGNCEETRETQGRSTESSTELEKRYYPNGKLAARAHGRDLTQELYWRRQREGNGRYDHQAENGRFAVWQQL